MSPPRPGKLLERLRRAAASGPPRVDMRPRRTKTPWHGFGPGDWPREEPLPQCPSPRCRRARQCIAPVNGLYCQRTHYSAEEQALLKPAHPLVQALASIGPLLDPDDLAERARRVADLAAIRRDYDRAMLARWQAGLLPPRFGPYRAGGAVVAPPPRVYVAPEPSCTQNKPVEELAKRGGQGGRSRVQTAPLAPLRGRLTIGMGD